jgi:RNA polymerase sigma-70 factor (ECF subfamily)
MSRHDYTEGVCVSEFDVETLLLRAKGGDGAALGRLLEVHRSYLRLLARMQLRRFPGCKDDDSDIVQEVFLTAHNAFDQFRGSTEAAWTAWLRRILATRLANAARRFLGTRQRDARREVEIARRLDESSQCLAELFLAKRNTPSAEAVRREAAVLLADALDQLPPDYREVVMLRNLEELSFPEVAERMRRSVDSVKNLWARAIVRLRPLLRELKT